MPECFRLWLVRLKVITFHFLDWPFQSHLEVEVHTDHGEYYEETFKFNNILDPLAAVSGALLAAERSLIGAVSSGCPASSSTHFAAEGGVGDYPLQMWWVSLGNLWEGPPS